MVRSWRSILALVSHEDWRVISARITETPAHKKATPERTLEVPRGWQATREGMHRDANAEGQRIIQAVQEWREQGVSLRQHGHVLTERAMHRRSGRGWHPARISNLLKAWEEWPVEARS
jgi:hypothetical protein